MPDRVSSVAEFGQLKTTDINEEHHTRDRIAITGNVEAVGSGPISLVQSAPPLEEDNNGPPSEFSGLVSYFSSQHDDYNT